MTVHSVSRGISGEAATQPNAATAFDAVRMWQDPAAPSLPNGFTCDVEDYFQVGAFEKIIPQARWGELEWRLPRNVDRILQLMSDARVSGTFFTLGWVAQRLPEVVRRIADAGHEIASHGMSHVRVWRQRPEEFHQDVATAKRLLEDTSGTPVRGYRAPSWSFNSKTPWMHRILEDAGYEYSSSIYPITHDHYGVPDAPVAPFYAPSTRVLEIPASTARFLGRNWPAAGGGYFRLLPLVASLRLLRRARRERAAPVIFYFHPWELDPEQPRIAGAAGRARFRHYVNLHKTESRLKQLLTSLPWDRMDRVFCRNSRPG